MKKLIILLCLLTATTAYAKHLHKERWYQERWTAKNGGVTEYRLDDGCRVDILTGDYAIEVDFAKKWAEAVGQSLYYAAKTGKRPGIVLICEKETDSRYAKRIKTLTEYWGVAIRVWCVTPPVTFRHGG